MINSIQQSVSEVLDGIYEAINPKVAFPELALIDKGAYSIGTCPSCNKKTLFIYNSEARRSASPRLICNRRNSCTYNVSIFDYVQAKNPLLNTKETIQELAKLAGYQLPNTEYESEQIHGYHRKMEVMERANQVFQRTILEELDVLMYLRSRGYSDQEITGMGLGCYPQRDKFIGEMAAQGCCEEELKAAGLLTDGFGGTHRMTLPARNAAGRINGFVVRSIISNDKRQETGIVKYKYTQGIDLSEPLCINNFRKQSTAIIVEGPIDALYASSRGIDNIVATGTNSISDRQL